MRACICSNLGDAVGTGEPAGGLATRARTRGGAGAGVAVGASVAVRPRVAARIAARVGIRVSSRRSGVRSRRGRRVRDARAALVVGLEVGPVVLGQRDLRRGDAVQQALRAGAVVDGAEGEGLTLRVAVALGLTVGRRGGAHGRHGRGAARRRGRGGVAGGGAFLEGAPEAEAVDGGDVVGAAGDAAGGRGGEGGQAGEEEGEGGGGELHLGIWVGRNEYGFREGGGGLLRFLKRWRGCLLFSTGWWWWWRGVCVIDEDDLNLIEFVWPRTVCSYISKSRCRGCYPLPSDGHTLRTLECQIPAGTPTGVKALAV